MHLTGKEILIWSAEASLMMQDYERARRDVDALQETRPITPGA